VVHFKYYTFVVTDISEEDMTLHEQWYQRYEILKMKQKQAIQKWRTLKNKMSQEKNRNSKSVELNVRSKVENLKDSVEKKQKIEEWKVIYLTYFLTGHLELCISSEF
jgi:carbonic anhydrase